MRDIPRHKFLSGRSYAMPTAGDLIVPSFEADSKFIRREDGF
jgi:hypothetical protein